MKKDFIDKADFKNAYKALKQLHGFAQLEHRNMISFDDITLRNFEVSDFILGRKTLDEIREDRRSGRTYDKDLQKETSSNLPALRGTIGAYTNPLVRDQIEYEIKSAGRESEDAATESIYIDRKIDQMLARMAEEDSRLSPEEKEAKEQARLKEYFDRINNYGLDNLKPHEKLIWVIQARKAYENDELTIKTQDGDILPARQIIEIKGADGNIIQKETIDNLQKSIDQKLYDKNGEYLYSTSKVGEGFFFEDDDKIQFDTGTPRISDLSEDTLTSVLNEYIEHLSEKKALTAHVLAKNASKLIDSIRVPELDADRLVSQFRYRKTWGRPENEELPSDDELNAQTNDFVQALTPLKGISTKQAPQNFPLSSSTLGNNALD